MQLWSMASQGLPATTRNCKRQEGSFPRALEGVWPWWHLDFRLLASGYVTDNISFVLRHSVCGDLFSSSRKLILKESTKAQRGQATELRFPQWLNLRTQTKTQDFQPGSRSYLDRNSSLPENRSQNMRYTPRCYSQTFSHLFWTLEKSLRLYLP